VPRELETWCTELAEGWAKDVAPRGVDVVGDLADLVPTPAAFTGPATGVDDAEVAASATEALAELLHRRQREVHELEQLRERVAQLESELGQATKATRR
jgi:hypothetical protein